MAKELIRFENISKSFDGTEVLKDLTLSIHENEFVTLLGPSGCGKTTTLRILGGQATTYTFANTHGLEEVRIFDSGSSRAVTIASAPAAAVQVMMLGGANGRVEFTAEPGCQLAFDQTERRLRRAHV